ncbi:MAG: ferrous iron transport protein A [Anaerolineae bacterium]|nr:ferrous iron transport protein A [Anaerolineae bacterium]
MPPTLTLDQLTPGQRATVTKVGGSGPTRRRILDMGITRGISVEMIKAAPLGDPIEYLVRDYHLSLRKGEARCIEIER